MKEGQTNGFRFSLATVIVILFVIVLTLVLAIAYAEFARGGEPPPIEEYRMEMFGWDSEHNILVWTISEGKSNAQGDYKIVGKPRTYAWRINSGVVLHDGVPHELTEEWRKHLEAMMLHVAFDLYKASSLGMGSEELAPARIEGAE